MIKSDIEEAEQKISKLNRERDEINKKIRKHFVSLCFALGRAGVTKVEIPYAPVPKYSGFIIPFIAVQALSFAFLAIINAPFTAFFGSLVGNFVGQAIYTHQRNKTRYEKRILVIKYWEDPQDNMRKLGWTFHKKSSNGNYYRLEFDEIKDYLLHADVEYDKISDAMTEYLNKYLDCKEKQNIRLQKSVASIQEIE